MTFLDNPEINKAASSTVVRTLYSGTNIYNHESIYLKCVADGIPEPTYKWNNAVGHEAGVKSIYLLQNPGPAEFGKYECRTSNVLAAAQHFVEVKEIGMLSLFLL